MGNEPNTPSSSDAWRIITVADGRGLRKWTAVEAASGARAHGPLRSVAVLLLLVGLVFGADGAATDDLDAEADPSRSDGASGGGSTRES